MTKINNQARHYREIIVPLTTHAYTIYLGAGLLHDHALLQKYVTAKQVFIVTNTTVGELYLSQLVDVFHDYQCDFITLPDGEYYKNISVWNTIFDALIAKHHHRDTTIIALGGGVIGDMAGFAAACYQRGVPFIQLPTTLLAQVDAAIGGKTAINHPHGKNMIGAFYQPQAVIIDVETLKTLPTREFKAGLAEVIKYALLDDPDFFIWLTQHVPDILQLNPKILSDTIEHCCKIKARIVASDEKEANIRALLNLGHTFAHAIEAATDYTRYLHGEAVAIGLYCASILSYLLNNITWQHVVSIHNLLKSCDLPTTLDHTLDPQNLLQLMATDKKVMQNKLRFVLLKRIGEAIVTDNISAELITKTLTYASRELRGENHAGQ